MKNSSLSVDMDVRKLLDKGKTAPSNFGPQVNVKKIIPEIQPDKEKNVVKPGVRKNAMKWVI